MIMNSALIILTGTLGAALYVKHYAEILLMQSSKYYKLLYYLGGDCSDFNHYYIDPNE